jgi:phosphohistidine phosphatase SixA
LAGIVVLVALVASAALAQEKRQELVPRMQGAELVKAVQQGGTVILLRHTSTERHSDETIKFVMEDCTTQRTLTDEGRREAKQIGEAFQKLGIQVDEVLSSPYCRTLETGRIAFGKATATDVLSVGDALSVDGKVGRGTEIRKLLDTPPAAGKNTILITHTGNLLYSFGLDSRPEGIAHVFAPNGTGRPSYLGHLAPDEWAQLSGGQAATGAVGTEAKP